MDVVRRPALGAGGEAMKKVGGESGGVGDIEPSTEGADPGSVQVPASGPSGVQAAPGRPVNVVEQRSLRILVAEDTKVNQMLITRILHKMGHDIDVAKNGLEAVQLARETTYDLILMDLQMPEMDGIEATATILREAGSRDKPRVVAVTANDDGDNRQRCAEVGMDDFVSKPFTIKRLQAVVEATLR